MVSLPASASEELRNLLLSIGPDASSSTTIPNFEGITIDEADTTISFGDGSTALGETSERLVDGFDEGSAFNPESALVALLAEVDAPVAVFVPAAGVVPAG